MATYLSKEEFKNLLTNDLSFFVGFVFEFGRYDQIVQNFRKIGVFVASKQEAIAKVWELYNAGKGQEVLQIIDVPLKKHLPHGKIAKILKPEMRTSVTNAQKWASTYCPHP